MKPSPSLDALRNGDDPALFDLVEEMAARLQSGDSAEVEAWIAAQGDHADQLRRLLPTVRVMAELGSAADGSAPPPGPEGEPVFGVLGDFRIVRELGRGGMGVVYEAEQISLGRRVALKVLPFAATMDPRQLQRFHNEARAAASLHHEHIVPVHAVGCARNVHYYAMQFIEGQSLAEVIAALREGRPPAGEEPKPADTPVPGAASPGADTAAVADQATDPVPRDAAFYRRAAEWGIEAAGALEHAHALGVVHRDVKPANLMIDGRGKLSVTDFGLARLGTDAGLTMTGDVLGTLRYMSPEQALAKHGLVDHRTDVYSLGATLYELLTGRPAVEGQDRQEVLRRIAADEPPPPRRLNKAIPAELEIIVLKALEKDPHARYATAQELADDLRRWGEHRPIEARRPSLRQVAAKWARRHRPLVAAAAAVLVVSVAALAGSIGWAAREQAARRAETEQVTGQALEEAALWQERGRLPEALSAARRAEGLVEGRPAGEALRQRVRARLADLELLDKLENIRLEQMTVWTDSGFGYKGADALYTETFRDAGLDVESLPTEEAGKRIRNTTIATELAAVLDDWAAVRRIIRGADPSWKALLRVARAADPDAGRDRLRNALEQRNQQALAELAASDEILDLAPATLVALGYALSEGEGRAGQVEELFRKVQRRHPDDFWANFNLAQRINHRSQSPPLDEVIRFYTAALALRPQCAGVHLNLGKALHAQGKRDEAIAEFRQALQINPNSAMAHSNLGSALAAQHKRDEAIAEFRQALQINPELAEVHLNLGLTLSAQGKRDEAIAELRQAH